MTLLSPKAGETVAILEKLSLVSPNKNGETNLVS
jgi:hypothetical protein